MSHDCSPQIQSLDTMCTPLRHQGLSFVQNGVTTTGLIRREDTNRFTYTLQPGFSPCH